MPQELLPILPPIVQRECVDGSGPKIRPACSPVFRLTCSLIAPGWQRTVRRSESTSPIQVMYFDVSITTARLTVSPDRLVPPPRLTIGAPNSAHARCVATTSSTDLGTTTPSGTWRKFDESLAYSAREPASKRTSPRTLFSRRRLRWPTSTVATSFLVPPGPACTRPGTFAVAVMPAVYPWSV